MKAIYYLVAAIFSLSLMCCSNDEQEGKSALFFQFTEANTANELRSSYSEDGKGKVIPAIVLTGNDIKWYNETTGELAFKKGIDMGVALWGLTVYLNDSLLFNLRYVSPIMSYVLDYPVLTTNLESGFSVFLKAIRIGRKSVWEKTVR